MPQGVYDTTAPAQLLAIVAWRTTVRKTPNVSMSPLFWAWSRTW
jgi:hypothetical protein